MVARTAAIPMHLPNGFIFLPNVKAEPRTYLARSVLPGARSVQSRFVGSSAWFGSVVSPKNHSPNQSFFFSLVYIYGRKIFFEVVTLPFKKNLPLLGTCGSRKT